MDELNYWRWCEELSIVQAAFLSVGVDPSSEVGSNCESWKIHERPAGYEAAKTAIFNAFCRGDIKGAIVPKYDNDINGNDYPVDGTISLNSRIDVESLRAWLARRGLKPAFFFPALTDKPDFLDPNNPRYAPKLAAAVRAWQAVTDPGKKSAKQALEKWLREHAAEFGLVDDDGNPVNQAVEECSKVANWNQVGGAPKTPAV